MHLQASQLIKAELAKARIEVSSEELRLGPVQKNQVLLVAGFANAVASSLESDLIIFDGHVIIDGASGIIEIPFGIFAAMKIDHITFLKVPAHVIAKRRLADKDRVRPNRTIAEIDEHQSRAIATANRIARSLGVPFTELNGTEQSAVDAFRRICAPPPPCNSPPPA
jgi:adenylate kinase